MTLFDIIPEDIKSFVFLAFVLVMSAVIVAALLTFCDRGK